MLAGLLACLEAHAATFNWPTPPAWSATGPASGTSATVDYGYNAAGSLRATVTNSGTVGGNDGVTFAAGYPSVQTSAGFAGTNGGFTGQNNLILYNSGSSSTTAYAQITLYFQYTGGASNVSFKIYDVDFGGNTTFIDQISKISATAVGGGTVYPTSVVGGTSNSVTGSGATYAVTGTGSSGNDSATGNVTITFAPAQAITSLTFQWANIATTTRTTQYIGVSPINFTAIGTAFPEVNSSGAALLLCGGLLAFTRRRNRVLART